MKLSHRPKLTVRTDRRLVHQPLVVLGELQDHPTAGDFRLQARDRVLRYEDVRAEEPFDQVLPARFPAHALCRALHLGDDLVVLRDLVAALFDLLADVLHHQRLQVLVIRVALFGELHEHRGELRKRFLRGVVDA